MGLAVLNGHTHIAFGESEGGSLWPGRPRDFSGGGRVVASTGRYDVVETAPELIVSLPVHVNGKEYFLDVFRERTIVSKSRTSVRCTWVIMNVSGR